MFTWWGARLGPINLADCNKEVPMCRPGASLALAGCLALVSPFSTRATPPAEGKPRRADRDGDPLPQGALLRLGTARLRHGDPIQVLTYSPDGSLLLSTASDRMALHPTTCLWEAATGRLLQRLPAGRMESVTSFSRDGKTVALFGSDSRLHLYNIADGRRLRRLAPLPFNWWTAALSPDTKILAALASPDLSIRLWDCDADRELPALCGPIQGPPAPNKHSHYLLSFSPDGKRLAAAGGEGEVISVRIWDVRSRKELTALPGPEGTVRLVSFSPNGKLLAVASHPGGLHVLEPAGRRVLLRLPAHIEGLFTPDSKVLAVRAGDGIDLVDVATGKVLPGLRGLGERWACAAFAPDGKVLAVAETEHRIRLWDVATGRPLRATDGHAGPVEATACSPDGRTLATCGADRTIRLWEAATGNELRRIVTPEQPLPNDGAPDPRPPLLAFLADGKMLGAAWPNGGAFLWDTATGKPRRSPIPPEEAARPRAFSPDGRLLLSAGRDGSVSLWELDSGRQVRWLPPPKNWSTLNPNTNATATAVGLSPDSRLVAAAWGGPHQGGGSFVPHLRLWEMASGRERRSIMFSRFMGDLPGDETTAPMQSPVWPLLFSPDGRTVAIGLDGVIHLWDLASHRELRRLYTGHSLNGAAVAFAPDGRLVAVGHRDAFSLSDVATGEVLCRADGHYGAVTSLAFSADGRRLITGGADTTALVWDVPALLREGKKRAVELSASQLEALWQDLGGEDGVKADRAVWALTAAPDRVVPFLRERLRPVAAPDERRVAQLVADLASDQFAVRERAAKALERLGDVAAPALRRAIDGKPSVELRRRVEQLLAKADAPITDPERLRPLLAAEALERIDTRQAREILTALASGASGARLTREAQAALGRLAKRPSD
jgi:WD40 repeat protein